jgi:hypothetical protein
MLLLDPSQQEQRGVLDRLFQMKFAEAERLFKVTGGGDGAKHQIAEMYALKSIEDQEQGNWIQAYSALKEAEAWNKDVKSRSLQVGGKRVDIGPLMEALEKQALANGKKVRFLIKPFPPEQMFHPDNVILIRTEEQVKSVRPQTVSERRSEGLGTDAPAREPEVVLSPISKQDEAFVVKNFRKALYAYFYNPIDTNAEFSAYLPQGRYRLWEKDFAIHPVDFKVSVKNTQVVIQPASWFRLTFSDQVHPSDIEVSSNGTEWKDLNHLPFGDYRVKVRDSEFTYPFVKVVFQRNGNASFQEETATVTQSQDTRYVNVGERGTCRLLLRERDGSERFRYGVLGY